MSSYRVAYMQALTNSLAKELKSIKSVETIFIGGGTPSTIEPKLYENIFKLLEPLLSKDTEITIEANPNSATKEWLEGMRALGVNRVSFGVQSFDENKLVLLNRAHTANQAKEAVINASKVGFKNISLDIIYDLFSDTKELIKKDLDIALSLPINHISSYELTLEKATEFIKRPEVKKGSEELGFFLRDYIVSKGLEQYEVSNYGIYKSRHNLGYWQHKEYLGVGAGAVGFIDNRRYHQHSNLELFIKEPTFKRYELLSKEDILTEKILLGLRSIVGVSENILTSTMLKRANLLVNEGKLEYKNGSFYNKEFFLSDEIALFIMEN